MALRFYVLLLSIFVGWYFWTMRANGPSGFGWTTTSEQVIPKNLSLAGKNVIVTGGYGGIGLKTTEELARLQAHIWLPARPSSMNTCKQVVEEISRLTGNKNMFCEEMDLGSLRSVSAFASKWAASGRPLHLLVNNAGIMAAPYTESVDGFELQFATNHLGHFLLTTTLMDNLRKGTPSRVVTVSSAGHRFSNIRFDDLTGKGTWYTGDGLLTSYTGPWIAYGQAKTANILFGLALNRRMAGFGTSNSLHPGAIATGLARHLMTNETQSSFAPLITGVFFKSVSQGAATQLHVALAPELEGYGGRYFEDCNVKATEPWANDFKDAEKLWELSEKLVAPFRQNTKENK